MEQRSLLEHEALKKHLPSLEGLIGNGLDEPKGDMLDVVNAGESIIPIRKVLWPGQRTAVNFLRLVRLLVRRIPRSNLGILEKPCSEDIVM